ncbi:MAG: hypothetical protein HZA10_06905 [Nitrospirae bacterium]|nr:hypothetical protein [Nitrospirota bacterium]
MPTFKNRAEYEKWKGENINSKPSAESAGAPEVTYYAVRRIFSDEIMASALRHGVTPDALLDLWISEKLQEQKTSSGN